MLVGRPTLGVVWGVPKDNYAHNRLKYILQVYDTPPLSGLLQIHGAAFTAWILLLIVQTRLIAYGRRDIHRLLGFTGTAIGASVPRIRWRR